MKTCYLNLAGLLPGVALLWACSSEPSEEMIDCNQSNLSIAVVNTTNPGCNQTNGSITVSATGGTGSYMYSIDGVNFTNTANFGNLPAGSYTLSVRDNNQCIASVGAALSSASNVSINTAVENAGCGTTDGSISVTATGGAIPYMYRINEEAFQSGSTFTNLANGSFTVTVRDDNGCEAVENVVVTSGLSLASDIKPIIEANCATSGCHVGAGLPDFRNSATIVANASNIRLNTQNKTMPPPGSGTLTDEQIQKIACWVNDGALNN
jgi:hypothetical protein